MARKREREERRGASCQKRVNIKSAIHYLELTCAVALTKTQHQLSAARPHINFALETASSLLAFLSICFLPARRLCAPDISLLLLRQAKKSEQIDIHIHTPPYSCIKKRFSGEQRTDTNCDCSRGMLQVKGVGLTYFLG